MSASLYKLPNGETVFNYNGKPVYAGMDGWIRATDSTMELALIRYGAQGVGAVTSEDAAGNPSPLQIPRDGSLGGGGGGASTLASMTDMGTYDIGSNNPSVTAIKNTANAAIPSSQKGAASGVASLDGSGKVPTSQLPSSVLGGLNYQGTYNAATNTPAIVAGNKGYYWKVSTAGTSLGHNFIVGDWAVDNGTSIDKVDGNENEVLTVAGRTGNVVLSSSDLSDKAAANGVASLGSDGKVPTSQITGKLATTDLTDGAALNASVSTNTTNIANLTAAQTVQTDNAQTGTSYTFALSDAGQQVDLNNASAITATIPPHSSVAFPVGTLLYWTQAGAGAATIAAGAGVTLQKPASRSYTTSAQYEGGYAYQVSQDTWRVYNN